MTLNYIIVGLIFFAGAFLVLASLLNAKFLFSSQINNDPMVQSYQEKRKLPGFKRTRTMYTVIGLIIIILGFVAIFNGFLEEKIEL